VIFSAILTAGYIVAAPAHSHLRFLKISDEEADAIHKKFLRIAAVSFSVSAVASFFPARRYIFIALVTIYYFVEMTISKKLIYKSLSLKQLKEKSFSCKLVAFINRKITFVCLLGMFFSIVASSAPKHLFFFENLNNIYCMLIAIILLQAGVSLVLNKIMDQLDSVQHGMHSQSTADKRQKNLIRICDIIIVAFYLLILNMFLKYIGVKLHENIFHDSAATITGIIFITAIIYRGFNEFADAMLEKMRDQPDYEIKLKTVLPTLSAVFYTLLFVTSTLLILSNLKINVAPILAAFTVFSAAIGLALQDIIKSFLHGITFLIEKNLYIGAYVKIDQKSGVIEKLSTRVLYLRDDTGPVHVIPYSAIATITNFSKNYLYYYGELTFNTEDDIQKISNLLIGIVEDMRKEDNYKDVILNGAEIHGLKPFDLTGPKIFWRVKTVANTHGNAVKYEIFRRLYSEYKKYGIRVPVIKNYLTVSN
jgi:small conductance mechanosensitive channel